MYVSREGREYSPPSLPIYQKKRKGIHDHLFREEKKGGRSPARSEGGGEKGGLKSRSSRGKEKKREKARRRIFSAYTSKKSAIKEV